MTTKTRTLSEEALKQILTEARAHSAWLPEPVSDDLLVQIYNLMKWGPTSANSSPARIVFVKSPEAKAKLLPCMAEGNVEKKKAAPVTAIISSLLLVQSASTAVRCQALTMPKWMRPFSKGQPGNQISSAISVMEIRANFAPEHRALNLMRHAKSSDFND